MTIFKNDLTGQPSGTVLTSTNSTGTGNTVLDLVSQSASAIKFLAISDGPAGPMSLEVTPDASTPEIFGKQSLSLTSFADEVWWWFDSLPTVSTQFFQVRHSSGVAVGLNLTTSGKVIVVDSSSSSPASQTTGSPTSTTVFQPATWYRTEVKGTGATSAAQIGVKHFVGAGTTILETEYLTAAANTLGAGTVIAGFRRGRLAGTSTNVWRFQLPTYRDSNSYVDMASLAVAPTANAGPDQAVNAFDVVTLTSAGSTAASGRTITGRTWRVISENSASTVPLSSTTAASPTLTAPADQNGSTIAVGLVVTDSTGAVSPEDTMTITVAPHMNWYMSPVSGVLEPEQWIYNG